MILINGHYEAVDDLYDVSRIIRKYYNDDLAYELDKLIEEPRIEQDNRIEELEKEVEDLSETIEAIRNLVW